MSKSRKSCANRTLRVRKINFLVEILKQPQILIFSVLTAKNSLRKLFGRLIKSALVLTKVTFWGKLFLWSFVFFCFWDIERKFLCLMAKEAYEVVKTEHFERIVLSIFVGKSRKIYQNGTLRVQKIFFIDRKLKYPQLIIFLALTAKNSLRKVFGRLMKSVLVFSTVTFWGKLVFWRVLFFLPELWV